jgi:hypothetical protein
MLNYLKTRIQKQITEENENLVAFCGVFGKGLLAKIRRTRYKKNSVDNDNVNK